MKNIAHSLVTIFMMFMTTQVNAAIELLCSDAASGTDAGKLIILSTTPDSLGKMTILYTKNRVSNDGWELNLTEDGRLYNADPMVQSGREYLVGSLKSDLQKSLLNIEGVDLICK